MVWSRVRPSFLAAVCGFLVGGVSLARAEPMGDLGGADRLVVRGPSAETAASLRKGLLNDGDLYWLGIPTADREPYLAALRTRVPLALEAAGFPEPRATVTVGPGPDGMEAVLIDIVAGERLTAGAIRVTGIPDDVARRLVAYLQQPQPPGDAVPETITLPDGSEKVLWFDAKGEPAKLGRPKWTPGEPAPCGERCASELLGAVAGFFSGEGYLSLDGWKDSWEEGYLDAIREHVDLEVRAEGDEAVLAIDVKRLPARTTLVGIEVNDGLRKTPADLLAYLGLTVGQPVTAADRQAWLGKLRLSGRFIKQACRFEPGGDGCVARFQLVEYKRAAPLDREASPEQQALLRARAWLLGEWHAGREIRIRATNQASHRLAVPLAEGVVEVASGYQGPGLFPSPGAVIDDAARFAWTPLRATASPRVLVQFGNRTVDDVPHLTDGALDALRVVAPSSGLGQLPGQITGHGQRLAGQLVTKIRRAAGFADEGIPLIIDSHSMRRGMAEQLRARGYNVRTVTEIFGTDPGDPAIKSLAETLGGRVLTNNMTDFGRDIAIGIDPRATTADTWIRILQEALGK